MADDVLPIEEHKEKLLEAIMAGPCTVVVGETGCGKTTKLPQYIHDELLKRGAKKTAVVITQPRRVAAISVAQRVAEERGERLGGKGVGYQVRFDNCSEPDTGIKYVTDGCLLRECLDDPSLSKYGAVILDEAHIRSLDTDILFGLMKIYFKKHASSENEEPTRLIIMSATLEHNKFSEFFECSTYVVPGRVFPVEVLHLDLIGVEQLASPSYPAKAVDVVMQIHLNEGPGDILVFLTGQHEIEKMCDELFAKAEEVDYRYDVQCKEIDGLLILPIYGSLPTAQQKRIFQKSDKGVRKVVVATEIASTSITIPGVVGFVKQKSYNPKTSLDCLQVVPISLSEASQRAGRAGRVQPGVCFRLYSKEVETQAMLEHTPPEIQRTSLTSVILTLKMVGVKDVIAFPYLDPPKELLILQALRNLYIFGALDLEGNVTELGRKMAALPLPPHLSRPLLTCSSTSTLNYLVSIVAMLCVENVFIRPPRQPQSNHAAEAHALLFKAGRNDFGVLHVIFHSYMNSTNKGNFCAKYFLHHRAVQNAERIREQIVELLCDKGLNPHCRRGDLVMEHVADHHVEDRKRKRDENDLLSLSKSEEESFLRALCHGLFHNSARQTENPVLFRTLDGNANTVYIHPSSSLSSSSSSSSSSHRAHEAPVYAPYVIFHEFVHTTKPFMRVVAPVEHEWIRDFLPLLHEVDPYQLSGTGAVREQDLKKVVAEQKKHEATRQRHEVEQKGVSLQHVAEQRTPVDAVEAARLRYLERKKTGSSRAQINYN